MNRDLIDSDDSVAFESGAVLTIRGSTSPAQINASGSHTLNMSGSSSYKPMDVDGNIRFFGCVTSDGVCDLDGAGDNQLVDVTSSLQVDEDRSSGSNSPSIAPWLVVNASVPAGEECSDLRDVLRDQRT